MIKFLIKINAQMTIIFKKQIIIVDFAIYLENGNVDFLGWKLLKSDNSFGISLITDITGTIN